jgi:flagellar biogenesis protein FliO
MKRISVLFLLGSSLFAANSEIRSIRVGGEKQAEVLIVGATAMPTIKVNGNSVDLTFTNTDLTEALQGKLDVEAPHALIHRASLFPTDKQTVKATFVVNGSAENLKQRLSLASEADGIKMTLAYPAGASAALNLLKEEQQPITIAAAPKKEASAVSNFHLMFSAMVIVLAAVASFFFAKFLRSRSKVNGSRKFLIEQLGYCSMGPKTGVSLIKVGKEFALIGVTPNQVTFLSSLPKLQEQYEEEAQFERGVFKEAVQEEVRNIESEYNA